MDRNNWERAKQLFSAAIEQPEGEQERFLDQQGESAEVVEEARSLLANYLASPDFLDGTPLEIPAELLTIERETPQAGRHIGPWLLVREIGHGGMGVVWEAQRNDGVYQQRAAVKLLRAGLFSERDQHRFREERQILATLNHPNIARLLDGGMFEDGSPYLVMEYIDGLAIDAWCQRKQCTVRQCVELCLEVCAAVEYAHRQLVIHRDLKPANILVTANGAPKLLDFGIAQLMKEEEADRYSTTRLMTPSSASPEQVRGDRITTASDVFSLGVLLYELLTGRHPFLTPQTSAMDAMRAICELEPSLPSSVSGEWQSQLRGELDAILLQALHKAPAERYGSVQALSSDLRAWLDGMPVTAARPSWLTRFTKLVLRYKSLSTAIAAAVLALVAGIVFSSASARIARRAEREALAQRDNAASAQRAAQADRNRALTAERLAARQLERATTAEKAATEEKNRALQESRRADDDSATTRAINDFLTNDLLGQANPDLQVTPQTSPDPDLKVRTALDRAAKNIQGRFKNQPLVEASIRESIGGSYYGLGRFDDAQTQFERAVELRRSVQGEDSPEALACATSLAMTYRELSQYGKAEALLKQLLATERKKFGDRDLGTLGSAAELGVIYDSMGRYQDAETLLLSVLNTRRQYYSGDQKMLAEAINDLTRLYTEEGKFAAAEPLVEEGLAISRRMNGEDHPLTILLVGSLKRIYLGMSRLEDAERLNLLELASIRRSLGPEHPKVLPALNDLGVIYRREGRFAESVDTLKQLVELSRRVWGAENEYTLSFESNLSSTLEAMGLFAEAESLAEKNYGTLWRVYGDDYRWTLASGKVLSLIYCSEGKYTLAEPILVKLVDTIRRVQGREHPNAATAMTILGQAYLGEGQLEAADESLNQALALQRKSAPGSPSMRMCLTVFARLRLLQKRYMEADSMLREAMVGPERQNLQIWDAADRQSLLGAALLGQGKYAEAEPLLLEGYGGLKKLSPAISADADLPEAGERLVRLYSAWGKPDKATEWQQRLASEKK